MVGFIIYLFLLNVEERFLGKGNVREYVRSLELGLGIFGIKILVYFCFV